jgi:uncharacterized protein YciI
MTYEGRQPLRAFFTCGPQSGRTSVPIIPQRVQTIREHSERTDISSGSQSPFSVALWWRRSEMTVDEQIAAAVGADVTQRNA